MVTSFDNYIKKQISEKNIVLWIEPTERLRAGWDNSNDPIYEYTVSHFVSGVKVDGVKLTEAASASLSAGEFYFDPQTFLLSVRLTDGSDPSDSYTVPIYRKFYATKHFNAPSDLSTGTEVPYEPLLKDTSSFSQEIDSDDLIGTSIVGDGNIVLENTDGEFDDIYDKLFWENAAIQIYSITPEYKTQIIFKGFVESKDFSSKSVTFKIKDSLESLKNEVSLPLFSAADGTFPDDLLDTPKRRIYGRAKVNTTSLDQVLDGFTLTGTLSGTSGTASITGDGTSFLTDLAPEDEFKWTQNDEEQTFSVLTIESDTGLTISSDLEFDITSQAVTVTPKIPSRYYNRERLITGHQIHKASTTVTVANATNRFTVADASDFVAGDKIEVNSEFKIIKRISSNDIIITTNLNNLPSGTVTRAEVQSVKIESSLLVENVDYTVTNSASGAKVTLEDDAEVNISRPIRFNNSMTFTNGSRTVTGTGFSVLRSRDWISPNGVATFYEILQIVDDTELELRINFAEVNTTQVGTYKRPVYVSDETIVHVDCFGKQDADGNFIKTGSQVVRDLMIEVGEEDNLLESSFTQAAIDMPYLFSMAIPFEINGDKPTVQEVINKVNVSIFGSLFDNEDYQIEYRTLTPKKPTITEIITDSDIIGEPKFISTGHNVVKTVIGTYQYFDYEPTTREAGALSIELNNDFVEYVTGIERKEEFEIYLYNAAEATIIMQRYALLRETSNTVIEFSADNRFIKKSLNDSLYFEFDRLFKRFGTEADRNKIGTINMVEKDGFRTKLRITDMGSFYNKIAVIAPAGTADYTSSTKVDRANFGYIVDTNETIDDNNYIYRSNLIG